MQNYEWILFDADDTLFHFDDYRGLQHMFSQYNIFFNDLDYAAYQLANKALWRRYQDGTMTAKELQSERFSKWALQLNVPPMELASAFLASMADISKLIEGAHSLLTTIKSKKKIGIVTNGFTELQQIRLKRCGVFEYFDVLVISEEVGVAKPHPGIFDYALNKMGNPSREKVLMVGDNPETDILGGINSGLHTCWYNAKNKPTPEGVSPHYQIKSLAELESMLTELA